MHEENRIGIINKIEISKAQRAAGKVHCGKYTVLPSTWSRTTCKLIAELDKKKKRKVTFQEYF